MQQGWKTHAMYSTLKKRTFFLILKRSILFCNEVYAKPGGGELPEKLSGGVRPASQNPYPIYDQKFETLFMT